MATFIPEYVKIRAHIMNLIATADGASLQIPPENELCRLFGVTRPTVRSAIKGLIDEGYLLARRGLGTFINPSMIRRELVRIPKMAVLSYDGGVRQSFYMSGLCRMIEMNGMDFDLLCLPNSSDPQRLVEMVRASFDAVLWNEPAQQCAPYLDALKASGTPLLAIAREQEPPCDRIATPDLRHAGRFIAEAFYAKGHEHFIYVHNSPTDDGRLSPGSWLDFCCKRMTELSGRKHSQQEHFAYLKDFPALVKARKDGLRPFTAIYAIAKIAPQISAALAQEGLSMPDDISFLGYQEPDCCVFGGLKPDFIDIDAAMRKAFFAWRTRRLANGDKTGVFRARMEYRHEVGLTLKDVSSPEGRLRK